MESGPKMLEKIAEAPAIGLDKALESAARAEKALISKRPFRAAQEYVHTLGPGLVTGAADDDPSGIATYSQIGARFGFQFLWLSLFTFPLMAVVQEMSARIGIATGRGLAANIRSAYSPRALYACVALLFAANAFNIGADLGAMAKATELMFPRFNFTALVIGFAAASLLFQIFTTYARYAKFLKYLTFVLFSYVLTALLVHVDWKDAMRHLFIPSVAFTPEAALLISAVLGTTISPYLFFWQSSQEVEEQHLSAQLSDASDAGYLSRAISAMREDVWSGMFFSNAVMFFIIVTAAAVLGGQGVTSIDTAEQAAAALKPLAGAWASLFFTLGIVGTGMLAIPVLAGSSSYAIAEALGWQTGLYRKLQEAYAFYGTIIIAMLAGLASNFVGLDPIHALLYAAVGNGLVAPIILFFIVRLSSDRAIMRGHANHPLVSALGWLTVAVMAGSGIAVLVTM